MSQNKKKTLDNETLSAVTHLVASLLSVAALALLVTFAAIYGEGIHVVGFSIFGASLIILYACSTIYHFLSKGTQAKKVFQILDHSGIYILIAGTYTPLVLIALPPAWGWSIFGIIWGLSVIGVVLKTASIRIPEWLSAALYIFMGWLIVIAIAPLKEVFSNVALFWLLLGGIFYTFGTVFFAMDKYVKLNRWYTLHDVFHIFVMLGSASHFWFMFKYVLAI